VQTTTKRGRAPDVRIKRAYEPPAASDGYRVLVDRLWPRGIRKETVKLDEWLREVAPSTALRKWFGHDPTRWREFCARYRKELRSEPGASALEHLRATARRGPVTLVYATRDPELTHARVLREMLTER